MKTIYSLLLGFAATWFNYEATAQTTRSNIYAVVVGVSSYKDSEIPNLKFADKDAQLFYDFLKSPNAGAVSDDNMVLLTNANATRSNIIREVVDKFTRATKDDLVIFYFSGHGKSGEFENSGYLLGWDSEFNNEPATAISMDELKSKIDRCGAKMKISYIDACHAGLFKTNGAKGSDNDNTEIVNAFLQGLTDANNGNVAFLASSARQQSLEDEKLGHGIFTYYLIKGLQGEADKERKDAIGYNDGVVNLSELSTYLTSKVPKETRYRQTPSVEGIYDEDFPLCILRANANLHTEIAKRPERKKPDNKPKIIVTTLPADEKLSAGMTFGFPNCYGQYAFINTLKVPVTLYALQGWSSNSYQAPQLKIPPGATALTPRLNIEFSGSKNSVSDCTDHFIDFKFYFKITEEGVEKFAELSATVEAGKKKYLILSNDILNFTLVNPFK